MTLEAGTLALVLTVLFAAILVFRVAPLFLLRGRSLSPRVSDALGLIPAAAFAALVANDLLAPSEMATQPLMFALRLTAAAVVALVARKTGSLVWSAVAGMLAYALLSLLA
ncbi:AzlD domain-containing protein [Olsenella urininfantis]|uniref:AzlD domain-containing protein n=1 Tax=Olsenella urininfantis TaxID=1871033 RepID=UPI00098665C6|nr:AzlD domain-containing protein [Olsenella urininfantis]